MDGEFPREIGMKSLGRWFVRGLVVTVPLALTGYVLVQFFLWVDKLVYEQVDQIFSVKVTGLGFALAIVFATTVGWFASHLLGRWFERVADWFLGRIPLVNSIYGTAKDILQALGGEKKSFERPVVVTLSSDGAKLLGFVTRDDLSEIGLPGDVAVLLQQSLNFAGNIVIFPRSQVRPLPVEPGKFMTFVMSGGLTGDLGPGAAPPKHFPKLHDPT
jgi:uncharacterized membrane protein